MLVKWAQGLGLDTGEGLVWKARVVISSTPFTNID